MRILGVHDSHNATAALLDDGKLVAVVQEERLTREKNQYGIPRLAIQNILEMTGLGLEDIDRFAFVNRYLTYALDGNRDTLLRVFATANYTPKMRLRTAFLRTGWGCELWEQTHAAARRKVIAAAGFPLEKVQFVEHHHAHAAAAYYGWGKMAESILVLTVDASGDGLSATVNTAQHGQLTRVAAIDAADSLGYLYAIVTYLMGMMPVEHEYKLMGLAPYAGDAPQVRKIADALAQLYAFDPQNPLIWHRTPGTPPIAMAKNVIGRIMERQRFDHICGGLQLFFEEFLTQWVQNCIRKTGIRKVALSGGVLMNVKANMEILKLPEVDELFIFPSCGDESNAIGAAYAAHVEAFANGPAKIEPLGPLYLGEDLTDVEAKAALEGFRFSRPVTRTHHADIEAQIADLLAKGKIVARAKGRMEFGARALGNRSILADPSRPDVVRVINDMIKMRDFWMPFAPVVRAEQSEMYMVKPKPMPAPYMIITFDVLADKREEMKAALHPYDWTARPQEIARAWNPDYYRILERFEALTGRGILLNTSFNLHGYPIVYRAKDALEVFDKSGLEYLALSNFLVCKDAAPE
jgi:carbamoyltransferase